MKWNGKVWWSGAVVVMLGVGGCVSGKGEGEPGPAVQGEAPAGGQAMGSLLGEWRLVSIGGRVVMDALPAGSRAPTLLIGADGRVSGFAGVNRMSSRLGEGVPREGLASGAFAVGPLMMTKMAGPPAMMEVEQQYAEQLGRADAFELKGNRLELLQGGEMVLAFERGPG